MKLNKTLVLIFTGLITMGVQAVEQLPSALFKNIGKNTIQNIKTTPVSGIYQIKQGGSYIYITADGKYAFTSMYDLENKVSLTKLQLQEDNAVLIRSLNEDDLIVYPAKGTQRGVLTVFTDTSCPYCTKLHNQIPFLQEKGIKVKYAPFPRGGKSGPGFAAMNSVYCSDDKKQAINIAFKNGKVNSKKCDASKTILASYKLGNRLGVNGTPASFTDKGVKISGYMPAQQLILKMGL